MTDIEQRVAELETRYVGRDTLRQPPLPTKGSFSYDLMLAQRRKIEKAAAEHAATEARIRKALEREAAETERQLQAEHERWRENTEAREKALADLESINAEIKNLDAERRRLRSIVAIGKPTD